MSACVGMSSIAERQKLMRLKWESQAMSQKSSEPKTTRDKKSEIEMEIQFEKEREEKHRKYLESLNKRIHPRLLSDAVDPPLAYRDNSSTSDPLAMTPSTSFDLSSTPQSLQQSPIFDALDDSAFGSLVDPDDNVDTLSVDEDTFGQESLPITTKKLFWERKFKEMQESERRRQRDESHLHKLRQRKESSRWSEKMKKSHSFTYLAEIDFSNDNLPTCEFVENKLEKTLSNEPKVKVDEMKNHWDGKLSRNSSVSHLNFNSPDKNSDDFDVQKDIEQASRRQKEWNKFQKSQNSSNHRRDRTQNKQRKKGNEDMRRSQSYSSLESFAYLPPSDKAEFRRRKPKMLHEKLIKGENVVVAIETSDREKFLEQNSKSEKHHHRNKDEAEESADNSTSEFSFETQKPRYSKKASKSVLTGKNSSGFKERSPRREKHSRSNSKRGKRSQSNKKQSVDDDSPGSPRERRALNEVLKRRDTTCTEKRRNLDKNWDQVCRKSEPRIEF